MGKSGTEGFTPEQKAYLAELQEEMQMARVMFAEAKAEFERACDAVFVFVRSVRESE
jgi:hypothetical protein